MQTRIQKHVNQRSSKSKTSANMACPYSTPKKQNVSYSTGLTPEFQLKSMVVKKEYLKKFETAATVATRALIIKVCKYRLKSMIRRSYLVELDW